MDNEPLIVNTGKPVINKNKKAAHKTKNKVENNKNKVISNKEYEQFKYDDSQFLDDFISNNSDIHYFNVEYGEHEEELLTMDEEEEKYLNKSLIDDSKFGYDKENPQKDYNKEIEENEEKKLKDSDERTYIQCKKYLDNVEEDLEEIVYVQPIKNIHSKLSKNIDKLIVKFDNVLDKPINKRKKKNDYNDEDTKEYDTYENDQTKLSIDDDYYYQQYSNYSNVIKSCKPIQDHSESSHFDKIKYPNEYYEVQYVNGRNENLPAKNINQPCLETSKYVYNHNKYIKTSKLISQRFGFIYARCSRKNDVSIETQRSLCFQYAQQKKIKLLPFGYVYDNNISARNMNNLKYELGFWSKYLESNSHIIIYSVDRLSRNLVKGLLYLDDMLKKNISIHFVNDQLIYCNDMSAATKSMVQYQLQIAENFSNITSEKIKATIKRKKEEGNIYGSAPYGFEVKMVNNIRKHVPNPEELNNVVCIANQYNYIRDNFHCMTETHGIAKTETNVYKTLKRWCNRKGLLNRKNETFTTPEIKRILDINTKYADIIANVITNVITNVIITSTPNTSNFRKRKTYIKYQDM